MNRGFLDSRGRKNNCRKKTDTTTGTGSVTKSDGTLNNATPLVDCVEKEVVSPSVVDKTVAKDKQIPLVNTTSLGSFPPLPTQETPSASNAPSVQYGISKELDTTYWGSLGVGTTFDNFQNIILIPYLEYGVLSPLDTTY
ncbi:hypothetical protein Tco_0104870 [Tanacetum coccineum]